MRNKIKKIYKNKYFKKSIVILIVLLIAREIYNIYVDVYNFQQLEKAIPILESIPDSDYWFYWLDKFNDKYNADIQPIKHCYYVSNSNWDYPYIYGFKLESLVYKIKYLNFYHVYPGYDLEVEPLCTQYYCVENINYVTFKKAVSNSCKD